MYTLARVGVNLLRPGRDPEVVRIPRRRASRGDAPSAMLVAIFPTPRTRCHFMLHPLVSRPHPPPLVSTAFLRPEALAAPPPEASPAQPLVTPVMLLVALRQGSRSGLTQPRPHTTPQTLSRHSCLPH